MTIASARQQADMKGVSQVGDYATPVGDPAKVQALINLVQGWSTMSQRGHLDQMSPSAQVQLLVELEALRAAVT